MRPHHSRVNYSWEAFSGDLVREVLQKAQIAFNEEFGQGSPREELAMSCLEEIWKERLAESHRTEVEAPTECQVGAAATEMPRVPPTLEKSFPLFDTAITPTVSAPSFVAKSPLHVPSTMPQGGGGGVGALLPATRKRRLNVSFAEPIDDTDGSPHWRGSYEDESLSNFNFEPLSKKDKGDHYSETSGEPSDDDILGEEEPIDPKDALEDIATNVALLDDAKACSDTILCQCDSINYSQGVWVMKLRSGVMKVDGGYFHFRLAIGQAIFK